MRGPTHILFVCALLLLQSAARLIPLTNGEFSSHSPAGTLPCESPARRTKVNFPESIAGRAQSEQGWSGYVNVTAEDYLFYWYFEAKEGADTAPLIIWSNGGPGCTAMEGATTELGPLMLFDIKQSHMLATGQLSDNPYAWNARANVLFVDQPRYVGFSTGTGPMVTSSVDAGKDMVNFYKGWIELWPEMSGRKVYLAAESYGGHYVPAWAEAIMDYNDEVDSADAIPLAGSLIGNGLVNNSIQEDPKTYVEFLHESRLLPKETEPRTIAGADREATEYIGYSPNYYDYRVADLSCPACYSYNYTARRIAFENFHRCKACPWAWSAFFTQPAVTRALNVCGDAGTRAPGNAFAGRAGGCIALPSFDARDSFAYSGALGRMLNRNLSVTLYYGEADRACDWVGGLKVANALEWRGAAAFAAAELRDFADGIRFKQHGKLSYFGVAASGHMASHVIWDMLYGDHFARLYVTVWRETSAYVSVHLDRCRWTNPLLQLWWWSTHSRFDDGRAECVSPVAAPRGRIYDHHLAAREASKVPFLERERKGVQTMAVAARIALLGLKLPKYQASVGTYRISIVGKVGEEGHCYIGTLPVYSPAEAQVFARNSGLRLLSTLDHFLGGDLDRVEQIVKVRGIVNGTEDFTGHGAVIDGCCNVLAEVFGEDRGVGARTCSGSGSLGAAVQVDLIVRVS